MVLMTVACNAEGGVAIWSTPTATPTLTPTFTPTSTPTPTATPTPTPTPTPQPLIGRPPEGIPRHRMHVAIHYAERRLEVTQHTLLENASQETWDEVVFVVPSAYYTGAFNLQFSEVTTRWKTHVVAPTIEGISLHVPLREGLVPGEPVQVSLSYSIEIPPAGPYDWPPTGNLGASERLLQVGDWHPVLAPYVPGEGWRTWTYHPVGDPTVYPLAGYDVMLVGDEAVVVATAGEISGAGGVRHYRADRARTFAFLASPEYQVAEGTVGGVTIRSYFLPEHERAGRAAIDIAARAIQLYETYYGPYPYPWLAVAENAYYGAMEYSGFISMSGSAYESYSEDPRALMYSLLVHEIAHQWWYGVVGNDQVHEPWLDEAFAKYSEVLFYERYYPHLTEWWWENHIYHWEPTDPLSNTIYDYPDTASYIHEIYSQGARLLSDLRAAMGDDAFFAFTNAYRVKGEWHLVTRADFMESAQQQTPVDLTPIWERYFPTGE